MSDKNPNGSSVSANQLLELFRFRRNPESSAKGVLFVVGILFTPITLIGVLLGYVRSYNRFMRPIGQTPVFGGLPAIVIFAMVIGAILIWLLLFLIITLLSTVIGPFISHGQFGAGDILGFMLINLIGTAIAFGLFKQWQTGLNNLDLEKRKFGTARYAYDHELTDYLGKPGLYIGGGYTFADKGHILTVAGTRGGKGTNLIVPNLLGLGGYSGSWVVIDPKAENAAITARYQRKCKQNVVILNPWGLLAENTGPAQSYNPLDIAKDKTSLHLIDDIQIIAEMIVPVEKGDRDKFFSDNARSIVAGLLLHMVTTEADPTLTLLWKWVRLSNAEWEELLVDMAGNDDLINGEAVNRAAYEILKLQSAGDKTFGSIIGTVLQCTEFLKSPALQESLKSGYNPKDLSDGKTTLYIIIPADKLQSHARWLRLVTITALRAVVRKPNKRVTFLLDEFAALGYLPEIENALSTYAGYNITVWPILQSLIQLQGIYGSIWETFIANATIQHYFSINDNFTASYVSHGMGQESHIIYTKSFWGIKSIESNLRPLLSPDELHRASGEFIFTFMGNRFPTSFLKHPYYAMNEFIDSPTELRYDRNPYLDVQRFAQTEPAASDNFLTSSVAYKPGSLDD